MKVRNYLVMCLMILLCGVSSLWASTIYWVGTTGLWSDTSNWSPYRLPLPSDDVYITNSGTYTVSYSQNVTVNSIHIGGSSGIQTFYMAGGTLYLSASSDVYTNGVITIASNGIYLTGNLENQGAINWYGGTLSVSSQLNLSSGAELNLIGISNKFLYTSSLNNSGTINWGGTGITYLYNGEVINNQAGGLFDVEDNAQFIHGGGTVPVINNAGTVRKSAGTGTSYMQVSFANTGLVEIQTGILELTFGGGLSTGNFDVSSGAILTFTAGTFNVGAGASFTGDGYTRVNGGTVTLNDSIPFSNLEVISGYLNGSGVATITNNGIWSGGFLGSGGTIYIPSGASFNITGASGKFLDNCTINNSGTVNWSGTGIFYCGYGAVVNNQVGGVFDAQSDAQHTHYGGAVPSFNNYGTFRKSAGAGITAFNSVPFNNRGGTVEVQSGTVSLNSGGTSTGGTLTASLNAILNFASGTHYLSGTYQGNPIGSVRLGGAYLQIDTSNATFNFGGTGFQWISGYLQGSGILTNQGLFVMPSSSNIYLFSLRIDNSGTMNWSGTGILYGYNGAVINNLGTGVFDAQNDARLVHGGGAVPIFNNIGTFYKSAGTGTTELNITFNNTGTVDVDMGTLNLSMGSGSSTGEFHAESGAVITFTAGAHIMNSGVTFTGLGFSQVNGGIVSINGTIPANYFQVISGTLNGAGNFQILNTCNWTGGTMSSAGITTVPFGSTLNISGANNKSMFARTMENQGTVNWTGSGIFYEYDAAVINNQVGAVFDAQSDAQLTHGGGGVPQFNNYGTYRKSTGTGASTFNSVPFNNRGGTIEVQSGTVSLNAGGISTGGTLTANLGAILNFASGTHYLSGTYQGNPAGSVRLGGAYIQIDTSNATFNFGGTGFQWITGTLQGSGTLTNQGLFIIPNSSNISMYSLRVDNSGTVNWSGTGILYTYSGPVINNQSSGLFDAQNDARLVHGGGAIAIFNNDGAFHKSAGTGTTEVNITFNNTGAVDVDLGTLNLSMGGGSSTGDFHTESGALITFTSGTHIMNSGTTFTGNGISQVNGGTVTVNGLVTAAATFLISNGILNGTGDFRILETCHWWGGTMSGVGVTTITDGAVLFISGISGKFLSARTLDNQETVNWVGSGILYGSDAAMINNQVGALFDDESNAQYAHNGGAVPSFNNYGTYRKSAGTGTSTFNGIPFNNRGGTVEVQSGTVSLSAGGISTGGTLTADSGAVLNFSGGTHIFSGTYQGNPSGSVRFNGANIQIDSTDATFALGGNGLDWYSNMLNGPGDFNNDGIFNITSTSAKFLNAIQFNNSGTVNWSGTGYIYTTSAPVFNNLTSGLFNIQNNSHFIHNGGGLATFNSAGICRKSIGVGTSTYNTVPFSNTGTIDILSGTMQFTGAGLSNLSTGVIQGTGILNVSGITFTNSGTVSPGTSPGILSITGNYPQSATAHLDVEIGGNTVGSEYDRLAVSATANLDGILDISLIDGFLPMPGDEFTIMTYGSRTGAFSEVNGRIINPNLFFALDYRPTSLVLITYGNTIHPLITIGWSGSQLLIQWGAVPGAIRYKIYEVMDDGSMVYLNQTTGLQYDVTSLIAGDPSRFFRVTAIF